MTVLSTLTAAASGALILLAAGGAQAAGMQVTSTSFADGAPIPAPHAGDAPNCGGKGVSPQVSWSNLPAGAKSVAIFITDPDGARGLGVSHWVVYNVAADRGALAQGEGQADGPGVSVGKNVAGAPAYRGMCPPAGDRPHHYTLTVVATDLAPGTLGAGLDREALLAALKGHALGGQSIVGLYGQP